MVNTLYPAEVWGINARAFEIAGAGGFLLIDWRPGLGQLFAEGEEVVPFLDIPDLRKKLVHYLAHPDERDSIARRGRDRAHRDHTFEARLSLLRDTVLGSAAGYPVPEFDVRRRS